MNRAGRSGSCSGIVASTRNKLNGKGKETGEARMMYVRLPSGLMAAKEDAFWALVCACVHYIQESYQVL